MLCGPPLFIEFIKFNRVDNELDFGFDGLWPFDLMGSQ